MRTTSVRPPPTAMIDHELRLARGISLEDWLASNAVSMQMLDVALRGRDDFGVLDMLASELGVRVETVPRAA